MIVTVYGRPGCHLCEEAIEGLAEIGAEFDFELVEIDIDSDPALFGRLLEKIPVVEIGGRSVCEILFEPDAVRQALIAAR